MSYYTIKYASIPDDSALRSESHRVSDNVNQWKRARESSREEDWKNLLRSVQAIGNGYLNERAIEQKESDDERLNRIKEMYITELEDSVWNDPIQEWKNLQSLLGEEEVDNELEIL